MTVTDFVSDAGLLGARERSDILQTGHFLTRRGRRILVHVVEVQSAGHALIFGKLEDDCLVRIQSRCLYGDALGCDDCDCGPELELALDMIQAQGNGVLIYLDQEGRSVGLVGKARGIHLSQTEGIDTFASYRRLGYPEDARSYDEAAGALKRLGLGRIRLLTNNPKKVEALRQEGLSVQRMRLRIPPRNRAMRLYLQAKREIRGHYLPRKWWMPWLTRGGLVLLAVGALYRLLTDFSATGASDATDFVLAVSVLLLAGYRWRQQTRVEQARFRLLGRRVLARYRRCGSRRGRPSPRR